MINNQEFNLAIINKDVKTIKEHWELLSSKHLINTYQEFSRDESFIRWLISINDGKINMYESLPLVSELNWIECSFSTKCNLLIQIALHYTMNSENQIIKDNQNSKKDRQEIQGMLDKLNEENINIFDNIDNILTALIEEEFNNFKIANIQQYIEKYIEDDMFLKDVLTSSPNNSSTVKELRQNILNSSLKKAIKQDTYYSMTYNIIEYIINKGGQLSVCQEEDIIALLGGGQLSFAKILIEKGFNIEKHKKEFIKRQFQCGNVEVVKYLINFFENKKELNSYFEQAEDEDQTSIAIKNIRKHSKQEIKEYMKVFILKEELEKELPMNDNQSRHKI